MVVFTNTFFAPSLPAVLIAFTFVELVEGLVPSAFRARYCFLAHNCLLTLLHLVLGLHSEDSERTNE